MACVIYTYEYVVEIEVDGDVMSWREAEGKAPETM